MAAWPLLSLGAMLQTSRHRRLPEVTIGHVNAVSGRAVTASVSEAEGAQHHCGIGGFPAQDPRGIDAPVAFG